MAAKLVVGGLSWDTTEDTLRNHFAQVGPVASAQVITDKFTGKSRGFGFVEMTNPDDAAKAIQDMNGTQLDGRSIVVNEAKPMAPRENRGGSGGGYGGRRGGGGGRGGFGGRRDARGGRRSVDRGGNRGDDRGGRAW